LILYVCPFCRAEVQIQSDACECLKCGRSFVVTLGGTQIAPEAGERELIARLTALFPTATVEEMSAARLAIGATNEERRAFYRQYHRTFSERGPAFYRMFQMRARQQGWSATNRCAATDIGC
jgi:hypothetical protein